MKELIFLCSTFTNKIFNNKVSAALSLRIDKNYGNTIKTNILTYYYAIHNNYYKPYVYKIIHLKPSFLQL